MTLQFTTRKIGSKSHSNYRALGLAADRRFTIYRHSSLVMNRHFTKLLADSHIRIRWVGIKSNRLLSINLATIILYHSRTRRTCRTAQSRDRLFSCWCNFVQRSLQQPIARNKHRIKTWLRYHKFLGHSLIEFLFDFRICTVSFRVAWKVMFSRARNGRTGVHERPSLAGFAHVCTLQCCMLKSSFIRAHLSSRFA